MYVYCFYKFLTDLSAPTITFLAGAVAVKETKKLVVRCRSNGYPVSKITWIRNGTKLRVCVITGAIGSFARENYQVCEQTNDI